MKKETKHDPFLHVMWWSTVYYTDIKPYYLPTTGHWQRVEIKTIMNKPLTRVIILIIWIHQWWTSCTHSAHTKGTCESCHRQGDSKCNKGLRISHTFPRHVCQNTEAKSRRLFTNCDGLWGDARAVMATRLLSALPQICVYRYRPSGEVLMNTYTTELVPGCVWLYLYMYKHNYI